jgi:NADH-quinone oxidoreductase subunit G
MFQKLFRELLESPNIDHRSGTPGEAHHDDMGALLGVGAGTNLLELGQGTTVLVLGADPEEEAPLYLLRLRGIAERGGEVIVANARPTKLERSATARMHYRPGSEMQAAYALLGAILEEAGSEKLSPGFGDLHELQAALASHPLAAAASAAGLDEAAVRAAAHSLVQAENGIIIYGADALAVGPALTHALASMAALAGKTGRANNGLIALLPAGNARGALDMGVRPDRGPGYQPLTHTGMNAREMWQAAQQQQVRAMYIVGIDPAASNAAARPALEKLDFLVVQDMFLTETAQLADVVLPAVSFAERDGTYTNAERRVQRSRQARPAHADSRSDWLIIQAIAQHLSRELHPAVARANAARVAAGSGAPDTAVDTEVLEAPVGWDYMAVSEVASEIAERVPGYGGITHSKLASTGMVGTWGRQTNEAIYYDGTNYENAEGVGLQYAAACQDPQFSLSLKPLPWEAPSDAEQYPFVLLVQKLLYDGDPLLRDSRLLNHVPAPYAALNPEDAERLGIQRGQQVRLTSAAGTLELAARVAADVPAGGVVVPAHLPDAPLDRLQTGPQTRVALSKIEG